MDKKVSIKDIDKIIKYNKPENKVITYKCGDEDIEIIVSTTPSMNEWYYAINLCARLVYPEGINEDDNTIIISNNEIYSIAANAAVLCCFTNLKTDNIKKICEVVTSTDLVEKVTNEISHLKVEEFLDDFDKAVVALSHRYNCNAVIDEALGKFNVTINNITKLMEQLPEELLQE